jgi:multicomponent Na+:H+ antiporter subunit B
VSLSLPVAAVLLFMLGSALAAAVLRDVVGSIVAFAGYSFGVAVLWALLRAPDVALTEAAVGAGITTVLFLLTIARTSVSRSERFEGISLRSGLAVVAIVVTVGATVPALPPVGAAGTPVLAGDVSQYYLTNAYDQTGVTNVVTAVLVGYRGFDTLGEVAVVFAAGVAMLLVLRREEFV